MPHSKILRIPDHINLIFLDVLEIFLQFFLTFFFMKPVISMNKFLNALLLCLFLISFKNTTIKLGRLKASLWLLNRVVFILFIHFIKFLVQMWLFVFYHLFVDIVVLWLAAVITFGEEFFMFGESTIKSDWTLLAKAAFGIFEASSAERAERNGADSRVSHCLL